MIRLEDILDAVESYKPDFDEELIRGAYVFSALVHKDQTRRSGEPYLVHPLNVAMILAEMKLDESSICVGMLHDVLEDTLTTKEKLNELFGADIADVVDGLTKISRYAYVSKEEQQAETFRKMILAMASDLRVILVSSRTGCTTCGRSSTCRRTGSVRFPSRRHAWRGPSWISTRASVRA